MSPNICQNWDSFGNLVSDFVGCGLMQYNLVVLRALRDLLDMVAGVL